MKNFLILSLFMLLSGLVYSQEIKIIIGDQTVETEVVAHSSDQIFTQAGNFNLIEINKIIFKAYDPKKLGLYNDLLRRTKLEFEDGAELTLDIVYDEVDKFNKNLISGPEDYLVEAGTEAIFGLLLPIAAVGVGLALEQPLISIIGGIAGFGLQISAWSKVRKAGKLMKEERIRALNSIE